MHISIFNFYYLNWSTLVHFSINPHALVHQSFRVSIFAVSVFYALLVLAEIFTNNLFVSIEPLTRTSTMHFALLPCSLVTMTLAPVTADALWDAIFNFSFVHCFICVFYFALPCLLTIDKLSGIFTAVRTVFGANSMLQASLPLPFVV